MGKFLDGENFGISFYNPLTKDVLPYEDLSNLSIQFPCFAFSSAPTSSACIVVIILCEGISVEIRISRSKEEGWETFDQNNDIGFIPFYTNPVLVDGAFYFISCFGNLGVLRLHEEGCDWEILEKLEKVPLSFSESYLAERNGEAFLVLIGMIGGWVQVFMLDKATMRWERIEDLGNYTLYVSRTSSLFTVANSPDTRNMSYFPRFCGEHLVSYSLSTKLLHSAGTTDSVSKYQGTMEPFKPNWS